MRVLIDECLPVALKGTLTTLGHECETVRRAGYGSKKNGELLTLAEGQWDVLLTSDRNIKYQQNLTGRNAFILHPLSEIEPHEGFVAVNARLRPSSPLDPARPSGRGRPTLAK